METRLFVVPRSIEDRTCVGVLVVPPQTDSILHPPGGIPCRLIAGRLFVPAEAILYPPLTDAEVRALCLLPVSFFHPAFGLSGFEEESTLRVCDLIRPPAESADSWNSARAGVPPQPRLNAVMLRQPPSIEDLFGGAPDEIGSEQTVDLPPAPGEPEEDPITRARRRFRQIFLKGVAGALRRVPHLGSQRTWVNGVEDWAHRGLLGVNQQLERLRNKELHRLLHLLDTDPESGLRHAIPMSGFAHRGRGQPGGRLVPRSLSFDPNRLGGGPADFWNVPNDLQEVLRRRYREMADREMQLGRHRRAAYIYAELLGDLVSAANALKKGRLFREAALLYEDHLRNPLEAAHCLAEGGLLAEAIERYEKLGRWLDVADLYERAGDLTEAENAIRRVVSDRLAQQDVLGAAKLVEERLRAFDEALNLLLGTWPSSHQAASCVPAVFQLLARLGRHEAALERLACFSREPVPDSLVLPLMAALSGAARDYPHERVRRRAADFSRVLIARQLNRPVLSAQDAGRMLDQLVRLAPRDRLLARDANRHLAERRNAELRVRRVTPPPVPGKKPSIHRRFELPRQIQWLQLRREWHWFYALGVTARRVTLLRGVWEGDLQSLSWDCPAEAVKQAFVFEPTAEQGNAVALARSNGLPLAQKRFPAADQFFSRECVAGTPSWLPTQGFPFAIGEDAVWTVHLASGRAILSCYDKVRGQLQRTIDITNDLLGDAERSDDATISLAVLRNGVAVALGNCLVLTSGDGGLMHLELPGPAIGLLATIPNTRQGVAVMLQHGAVMYWVGANSCIELDKDIPSPIGAFVPGGPLVLVSGSQVMLMDVDSRGVHNVARLDLTGKRVVGVSSTANHGEFAVLEEGGQMTIYRVPR